MLSLSRRAGESLDLFIDYDDNPALVALVERLGGRREMLAGLGDRVNVRYVRLTREAGGVRFSEPEAVLGITAPPHVDIYRTETLRQNAS